MVDLITYVPDPGKCGDCGEGGGGNPGNFYVNSMVTDTYKVDNSHRNATVIFDQIYLLKNIHPGISV